MTAYKKDMRANPVKTIVALGESHTWGYSVPGMNACTSALMPIGIIAIMM